MNRPRNPFILGHKISRPYFCDRIDEERNLVSAVTNGRNVLLISPRRMGKTSLAYVAFNESAEVADQYITIFIDILQTDTLGEFTYLLGKAVFDKLRTRNESYLRSFLASLKSLKGTFGFDPVTGSPTFNIQLGDITRPEYTLEEIFGYLERCDKQVIIVIDEFQQITKYPEKNVEAMLRSHIQLLHNTTLVFAGSERTILSEMFLSSKRPFYNSAEVMHLGPISRGVYVSFAHEMFSSYGKSIDNDAIDWAFSLFNGNTFYMQRTMNEAFADTPEGAVCDHDTVHRSVRSMLAANELVYREVLSNISISQKSVLYSIAQEKTVKTPTASAFVKGHSLTSASSVQSALSKLTKMGLVAKEEQGYSLTDPLMRIFINNLYATPEI